MAWRFSILLYQPFRDRREAAHEIKQKAEDIDLFVFHQANRNTLDHLRTRLKLPAQKIRYIYEGLRQYGPFDDSECTQERDK